ncbi:MAG: DUF2079 domain-containing protein [Snowella sp.]|nr:DUF2079 domain-containing protein [Snowella sp.]
MFKKIELLPSKVLIAIGTATLIFLISSIARHLLFQSNALDLGWFDQAVYLISQNQNPIISFRGFHILGDHASFILYPIALFYKLYPSVYWLLFIQAIALSLGAWPIWLLANQAGLKDDQAFAVTIAFLLYPLLFNVNLFDFHPEVIALPAILWAIWTARNQKLLGFIVSIVIILSCKAVLSLTVAAMGFWLLIWEKKKVYGVIALISGVAWFIIATKVIIPQFSGAEVAAVGRYSFLGNSVTEIIQNLILKPNLILGRIFTGENLGYLLLLIAPVLWGLSFQYLTPLIPALPSLFLNLLTDYFPQKDITHQYSIAILPFLFLAVITSLAHNKGLVKNPKGIIIWSLITFLALGKYGYFFSKYLENWDNLAAMQEAVSLVKTDESLLVSPQIAPHLSQRVMVQLAIKDAEPIDPTTFTYILLNTRHPGWENSQETVKNLVQQLQQNPDFKTQYQRDDIWLFQKKNN